MSNKKLKSSEVEFEYMGMIKGNVQRDMTIVRFHSSVTEVGVSMFRDCEQLKEVVLNEGLKKIRHETFYECRSLESVTLPSTVIEIGSYAFQWCSSLKEVVLNEGLHKIEPLVFAGCTSLERITIPSTVTEISINTFYSCQNLRIVGLNEGLNKIENLAFASCTSLERITIPLTVTEISAQSFRNCHNLREVGLHDGIQKIGPCAFEECSALERFKFPYLSTRLDNIIRAGLSEAEDKVENIRGLVERRGGELFVSDVELVTQRWRAYMSGQNWKVVREILGRIDRLLTYYELREATTLLELAMWKSKIDKAEVRPPINRDIYRIDIPGPVKNTILQYLNFRV